MAAISVWERGRAKMELLPHHIPWGNDEEGELTRSAMNKAFEVYYNANTDENGNSRILTEEQSRSLHSSLTDGSSWFGDTPDDLQEAFQLLHKRFGHSTEGAHEYWWNDEDRVRYDGNMIEGSCKVPKSIHEFLKSVEGKLKKVLDVNNDLAFSISQLNEILIPNNRHKEIGETLKKINKTGEHVERFLWLAPKYMEVNTKNGLKILKYGEILHDVSTAYADGHLDIELAAQAVDLLPVLGAFYAGAIRLAPGLKKNMTGHVYCRTMRLDVIGRGGDPHLRVIRDCLKSTNKFY